MSLILSGSDGLSDVDGTAATPAIRGTDTNTGIFFPAADTIAFSEGGTESMRIDSSGNVGIGTINPIAKLDVNGASAVTSFTGTTRLGVTVRGSTSTNDYSGIDFTGTAINGPTARIAVLSGSSGSSLQFGTSNIYGSGITNTAMTIDSSGNLLVGRTTQPSEAGKINILGTNCLTSTATTPNANFRFQNSSGTQVGFIQWETSTTTYSTSSDYRLKENIAPMTGALATVAALKPVTYKWKVDGSSGQGFIAHELQEVVPDCVTGEKDAVEIVDDVDADGKVIGTKEVPKYQGIDTSFLVATLTASIQELKAIVDAQAARIAALESAKA